MTLNWALRIYRFGILKPRAQLKSLLPGELKSGGHVRITHKVFPIIRVFCVIIQPRSDKRWWESLSKMFIIIFRNIFILIYLAGDWNRILFYRPTLWWGEMNLIGQSFSGWFTGPKFISAILIFLRLGHTKTKEIQINSEPQDFISELPNFV